MLMAVFRNQEADCETTGTIFAVVGEIFEAGICAVAEDEGCAGCGEDRGFAESGGLRRGDKCSFAQLPFCVDCVMLDWVDV